MIHVEVPVAIYHVCTSSYLSVAILELAELAELATELMHKALGVWYRMESKASREARWSGKCAVTWAGSQNTKKRQAADTNPELTSALRPPLVMGYGGVEKVRAIYVSSLASVG